MTYDQLKNLCVALYGRTWRPNLAHDLNIKIGTVENWRYQGCPKWLDNEIGELIDKREQAFRDGIEVFKMGEV